MLDLRKPRHLQSQFKTRQTCEAPGDTVMYLDTASFLTQGSTYNIPSQRTVVSTDASLTGWGAVWEGRMVRGMWERPSLGEHMSCVGVESSPPGPGGTSPHHPRQTCPREIERTDNTSTVYHINHQGGTRSLCCLQVVSPHLVSLRSVYVPGVENRAADLLSPLVPFPANGGSIRRL